MISYHPVQYKPLRYQPGLNVRPGLRLVLGQDVVPSTRVTPGRIKAMSAVAGTATLAVAAATVWVGYTVGKEKSGVLSVAGWVVAAAAGIAGLLDLVGTVGVLVMPTADMQAAIDKAKTQQAAAAVPAAAPATVAA